jgi:two-component system sensor histidine kinase KdpD
VNQLPAHISQRIRHEAQVAGLRDHAPSIEAVERRRMQLWLLTLVVVALMGLATIVASLGVADDTAILGNPWVLRGAVALLGVGFGIYAVEKEVHLHRLSRLLVDERVLSAAMARRIEVQEALAAAGKALNSVLELDEVLDVILARAVQLFGGATGTVMLLEDDHLRVVAVRGSAAVRDARVPLEGTVAGRVAQERRAVLVDGPLGTADGRGPAAGASAGGPGSVMCVPLVNRGRVLGVLTLAAAAGRRFDDYDLGIIELFAEPVAAAIAKAGLYEAERAHVARLLEAERFRSQLVASVSHELRTPITSIRGAVAAARRGREPERITELLEVIERQAGRLQAMVEEILASARFEGPPTTRPRPVDLAALVRLVALDAEVAGRPVEVAAPERFAAQVDPEAVRRIVGNLVDNAHKYGAPPVVVELTAADGEVHLAVRDHGPGVPAHLRQQVFERFWRADPNGTRPGMGLGLAIVKGLVEAMGGRVWVDDAPGGGARFGVALPVPVAPAVREVAHAR